MRYLNSFSPSRSVCAGQPAHVRSLVTVHVCFWRHVFVAVLLHYQSSHRLTYIFLKPGTAFDTPLSSGTNIARALKCRPKIASAELCCEFGRRGRPFVSDNMCVCLTCDRSIFGISGSLPHRLARRWKRRPRLP